MTREPENVANEIADLSERISSQLQGQNREVIGGVIADLMATFIAGHVVVGDEAATEQIRRRVLQSQIDVIWDLIDLHSRKDFQ